MIGVYISILILLAIIVYLYFTKRLSYLLKSKRKLLFKSLNKVEKWFLAGSLIATFTFSTLTNLVSSVIYELVSPNSNKEFLKIDEKQDTSIELISESNEKLDKLLKDASIDPRDIEQYLKNLPLKDGKEETNARIDEWYQARKISLEIKELLLVVTKVIFEQNEDLTNTITFLKSTGKTDFAGVLENIQKYFQEGDAEKIKQEYFSRKEKVEKENILILKQSIKSTEALFAFQQTVDLYKELILVEPTAENYFQTAYFLHKLKYFDEAANLYQKTLKIYRDLAQENPRAYLPNVAETLNNLADLHSDKNEFPQAQEKYEEALKIRRDLAEENPIAYLPDVATTLNNLAYLQNVKNEFSQAQEKCEEALEIRKKLAKENPKTYQSDVAMTLNNLAILHSEKNEFPQAQEKYEEALKIYRNLVQENPRTFLPDLAMTLSNLAILQNAKNEFPQAQEKYEEALKIYRNLAQENPRTYQPDVAMTLNNLAVLHWSKNEFPQAQEKYEEALKIQRDLAQENSRAYEIDYARMLIMGVKLFKKDKSNLKIAKGILERYQEVYSAQELLKLIRKLE
ncbi:MAG: tetratricopeptide repeat protein [Bacteroidales bacterium]|nr:tetratricopeptide repeat protein [Bacteroidales bacterium]